MSESRLIVERDGPIGVMAFDNPTRRNAISGVMWRAIPQAMAEFDADPEIRCVILRGEGTAAFAAGADISEFEKRRASEDSIKEYEGTVEAAQHALEGSRKPVIALIHGFCIGGGVEMALACDLRYAGASSQFAIPAARLGIGYGVHGTNRLVATVGHAAAREIMFTGGRYDAEQALAMGLVIACCRMPSSTLTCASSRSSLRSTRRCRWPLRKRSSMPSSARAAISRAANR